MTRMPSSRHLRSKSSGFTIVELICTIVIIGSLAAIAVPRYIAMQTDARVAAVNAMAASLWSAANMVHSACAVKSSCDVSAQYNYNVVIGSRTGIGLIWGYPNAGDSLGADQIDTWVTYNGFTASLPNQYATKFSLDGAPDPASCSTTYGEASASRIPTVTSITTGC